MNNPGSGVDEAKYFSMAVVVAAHVTPGAGQRRLFVKVLKNLAKAVSEQERLRGSCRDLDVTAATRERGWLYST